MDSERAASAGLEIELSDEAILEAMRELPSSLDISTEDFRALYHLAYQRALKDRPAGPEQPQRLRAIEPPRLAAREILRSGIGGFLGIAAVAGLNAWLFPGNPFALVIGSLGASAVLLYGAMRSPLAQPRNLLGGHVLSALAGVLCWKLFHNHLWLAEASAVAAAIALQHLTRTLHPPGGATALIAVIGSDQVHDLGFLYVVLPAAIGPALMLLVALIVNNVAPFKRRYPETWS
jgi:CBS-domain-containing membrane protein